MSPVTIEKIIKEFDRETLSEEVFGTAFQFLDDKQLCSAQKVKQINSSLGTFIEWAQMILSYHILVHPYRIRNRDSIIKNLHQGKVVLDFADTVDDFMNQFYHFKSFLMKIGFLSRDSHFAFNLSNISSFKSSSKRLREGNSESKLLTLPVAPLNLILSYFSSTDTLRLSLVCKDLNSFI